MAFGADEYHRSGCWCLNWDEDGDDSYCHFWSSIETVCNVVYTCVFGSYCFYSVSFCSVLPVLDAFARAVSPAISPFVMSMGMAKTIVLLWS